MAVVVEETWDNDDGNNWRQRLRRGPGTASLSTKATGTAMTNMMKRRQLLRRQKSRWQPSEGGGSGGAENRAGGGGSGGAENRAGGGGSGNNGGRQQSTKSSKNGIGIGGGIGGGSGSEVNVNFLTQSKSKIICSFHLVSSWRFGSNFRAQTINFPIATLM
jgi:hypothetical protein